MRNPPAKSKTKQHKKIKMSKNKIFVYGVGRMKPAVKLVCKKTEQVTTMKVVYDWAIKALTPYRFRIQLKIITLSTIEYTYNIQKK